MRLRFNRHAGFLLLFALCLIIPFGIMAYKLVALDYAIAGLMPAVSYKVELSMQVHGHGDDISISTYLPKSDNRQRISDEENSSGPFTFALSSGAENRLASWNAEAISGEHNIRYAFSVQADHLKFVIPPELPLPARVDLGMAEYLREEEGIQVNDPVIEETLNTVLPDRNVPLLAALTSRYAIVGHSERRQFYGDKDAGVAAKAVPALAAGLTPIACVGETLAGRDAGVTMAVVARQLGAVLAAVGAKAAQLVVAYEPDWAIGTGRTASPEEAQAVHAALRVQLAQAGAADVALLYGGSVKADNAKALFAMADIDGGLIGGASLKATEFLAIARA